MKITINARSLERNFSGIEIYTYNLLYELSRMENQVDAISLNPLKILPTGVNNAFSSTSSKSSLRKGFWELWECTSLVNKGTDIYHSPSFTLPLSIAQSANNRIITVHDVIFLKHPEFFDLKTKIFLRTLLRHSLNSAHAIICVSRSAANDLVGFFPSISNKIHVVHNGFTDYSKVSQHFPEALRKNKPFILFVGASNRRKNLTRALEAFLRSEKIKSKYHLVVAGDAGQNAIAHELGASEHVQFIGYVTESELAYLYANASLLLYPSIYEGFGLPILEAMSCDLPILTSNVSSMPEVSGYPSSLLVAPFDTEDIRQKLEKLLLDETIINEIKDIGRKQVASFSWKKMARETFDVYKSL